MKLENIFRFLYRCDKTISKKELFDMLKNNKNVVLVDVRSKQEFEEGHLEKAINISVYEMKKIAREILKDKEQVIITYCSMGVRSKKAAQVLIKLGYKNVYSVNEEVL